MINIFPTAAKRLRKATPLQVNKQQLSLVKLNCAVTVLRVIYWVKIITNSIIVGFVSESVRLRTK